MTNKDAIYRTFIKSLNKNAEFGMLNAEIEDSTQSMKGKAQRRIETFSIHN